MLAAAKQVSNTSDTSLLLSNTGQSAVVVSYWPEYYDIFLKGLFTICVLTRHYMLQYKKICREIGQSAQSFFAFGLAPEKTSYFRTLIFYDRFYCSVAMCFSNLVSLYMARKWCQKLFDLMVWLFFNCLALIFFNGLDQARHKYRA